MYPILISVASFHIFSFSLFLLLAWFFWSFLFWRNLRSLGIPDERIFDLMFYGTIGGFAFSRLGYVLTHVSKFSDNWLKIFTLWVVPGLSLFGGVLSVIAIFYWMSRRSKLSFGMIMDNFSTSFPYAFIIGSIGSLLDGTVIGKQSQYPWAVTFIGHIGTRHPVGAYEIIATLCIIGILIFLASRSKRYHYPDGALACWFFLLFAIIMFPLEFIKDTDIYWQSLSINQWILIAIFGEALGVLFVLHSGRQKLLIALRGLYARIPRRRSS